MSNRGLQGGAAPIFSGLCCGGARLGKKGCGIYGPSALRAPGAGAGPRWEPSCPDASEPGRPRARARARVRRALSRAARLAEGEAREPRRAATPGPRPPSHGAEAAGSGAGGHRRGPRAGWRLGQLSSGLRSPKPRAPCLSGVGGSKRNQEVSAERG